MSSISRNFHSFNEPPNKRFENEKESFITPSDFQNIIDNFTKTLLLNPTKYGKCNDKKDTQHTYTRQENPDKKTPIEYQPFNKHINAFLFKEEKNHNFSLESPNPKNLQEEKDSQKFLIKNDFFLVKVTPSPINASSPLLISPPIMIEEREERFFLENLEVNPKKNSPDVLSINEKSGQEEKFSPNQKREPQSGFSIEKEGSPFQEENSTFLKTKEFQKIIKDFYYQLNRLYDHKSVNFFIPIRHEKMGNINIQLTIKKKMINANFFSESEEMLTLLHHNKRKIERIFHEFNLETNTQSLRFLKERKV